MRRDRSGSPTPQATWRARAYVAGVDSCARLHVDAHRAWHHVVTVVIPARADLSYLTGWFLPECKGDHKKARARALEYQDAQLRKSLAPAQAPQRG